MKYQQLERGTYQVTVIGIDLIRIDLLDACIPALTGEIVDGWGCCILSTSQLSELIDELKKAQVTEKRIQTPVRKLGRPK